MAKAKYYRRETPDGKTFYVNENGDVVPEAVAKGNLVESRGTGTGTRRSVIISESTQRRILQNEERARQRRRTPD